MISSLISIILLKEYTFFGIRKINRSDNWSTYPNYRTEHTGYFRSKTLLARNFLTSDFFLLLRSGLKNPFPVTTFRALFYRLPERWIPRFHCPALFLNHRWFCRQKSWKQATEKKKKRKKLEWIFRIILFVKRQKKISCHGIYSKII